MEVAQQLIEEANKFHKAYLRSFTFSLHQKCGMEIVDQRKRISFFLLYL